jgi:hypothetical protein
MGTLQEDVCTFMTIFISTTALGGLELSYIYDNISHKSS